MLSTFGRFPTRSLSSSPFPLSLFCLSLFVVSFCLNPIAYGYLWLGKSAPHVWPPLKYITTPNRNICVYVTPNIFSLPWVSLPHSYILGLMLTHLLTCWGVLSSLSLCGFFSRSWLRWKIMNNIKGRLTLAHWFTRDVELCVIPPPAPFGPEGPPQLCLCFTGRIGPKPPMVFWFSVTGSLEFRNVIRLPHFTRPNPGILAARLL